MCCIIGYTGKKEAASIILNSLKKLEYRGYDSYGFATVHDSKIWIEKDIGKIGQYTNENLNETIPGRIGIGHTRWATHGGVTKDNAHPHTDCEIRIAVAHNGIIENYQELRKDLVTNGHIFKSETDTEIIPHLIEEHMDLGFENAVRKAVSKLNGRYAIVVLNKESNNLIGVRKGSPLILGVKDDEIFVASDVPAFLDHTRDVMYLDDNEMVIIDGGVRFLNVLDGTEVYKRIITVDWDAEQAKKGEYAHFMLKEIMEQKDTIMRAINQDDQDIMKIADEITNAFGTFFTGCGTAGKVCLAGEYIFSKVANKHINFILASEFPNYHHFLTDKTLLIAISQSGETADVLEAIDAAKKKGVKIISLVNVMGSSLDRQSDYTFFINAGPEKAVASTKAATSQLALITLLAYACAQRLHEGKRLLMEAA